MDVVTYALCKKLTKAVASGIKNVTLKDYILTIELQTGETLTQEFPIPEDGASIKKITIDKDTHELIATLTNNKIISGGIVPTVKGDPGAVFVPKISKGKTLSWSIDTEDPELLAKVPEPVDLNGEILWKFISNDGQEI